MLILDLLRTKKPSAPTTVAGSLPESGIPLGDAYKYTIPEGACLSGDGWVYPTADIACCHLASPCGLYDPATKRFTRVRLH